MRVGEQVDALELLGVSPMRRLVGPRVLACVLAVPLLHVLVSALAIGSGFVAEAVAGSTSWLKYQAAVLAGIAAERGAAGGAEDAGVRRADRGDRVLRRADRPRRVGGRGQGRDRQRGGVLAAGAAGRRAAGGADPGVFCSGRVLRPTVHGRLGHSPTSTGPSSPRCCSPRSRSLRWRSKTAPVPASPAAPLRPHPGRMANTVGPHDDCPTPTAPISISSSITHATSGLAYGPPWSSWNGSPASRLNSKMRRGEGVEVGVPHGRHDGVVGERPQAVGE